MCAFFSAYRRVMKTTVYELILQLYQVSWVQGMDDPDNLARKNMTDQMLHLVSNGGFGCLNQFCENIRKNIKLQQKKIEKKLEFFFLFLFIFSFKFGIFSEKKIPNTYIFGFSSS